MTVGGETFWLALGGLPISAFSGLLPSAPTPFYASRLEQVLALLRPRRPVVAGVSTTFALESTVRDASDRGYEVLVAADACGTGDPAMHEGSLKVIGMLATVATTDEIAAALSRPLANARPGLRISTAPPPSPAGLEGSEILGPADASGSDSRQSLSL